MRKKARIALLLTCVMGTYRLTHHTTDTRLQASPIRGLVARAATLEIEGKIDAAERTLLDAARQDRRFEPAWALANFYHRQDRLEKFQAWARHAAAMSYGDRNSLFQLIVDRYPADRAIREILVPELHAEFVAFLISTNRLDDATKLISSQQAGLGKILAERWIVYRSFENAWSVWTRTQNADIEASGLGFDWRLGTPQGISVRFINGRLEADFSGDQQNSGELWSRYLPLQTDRNYRLKLEGRGSKSPTLLCQIDGVKETQAIDFSRDWTPIVIPFRTNSAIHFGRLSMSWQGRTSGIIEIRNFFVELIP